MPDVSYYLGRPADFWIAVMSGAARPTVANPAPRHPWSARNPPRRLPREGRRNNPALRQATAASTSPLDTCGGSLLTSEVGYGHCQLPGADPAPGCPDD